MQSLPNATLVVHPRGARHMLDPSRLEASARAVYGDEEYEAQHGALQPVPEERMLVMEDGGSVQVGKRTLQFIDTSASGAQSLWTKLVAYFSFFMRQQNSTQS